MRIDPRRREEPLANRSGRCAIESPNSPRVGGLAQARPILWQQLVQTRDGKIGAADEDVSAPRLRIDVFEATGRDHRQRDGGAVSAVIRRRNETPRPFAANRLISSHNVDFRRDPGRRRSGPLLNGEFVNFCIDLRPSEPGGLLRSAFTAEPSPCTRSRRATRRAFPATSRMLDNARQTWARDIS